MVTEAVMMPAQEIADLQAQPKSSELGVAVTDHPESHAAPVAKLNQNRLDKRFRRLTKNIYQERDISRALNSLVARYDRLTRQQRAEIQGLERDLAWALGRIERLKRTQPITPDPSRYATKENK